MNWMAPEVLERPYDERSDVWSIGCIVLEMATCSVYDTSQMSGKLFEIKHSPEALEEMLEEVGKASDIFENLENLGMNVFGFKSIFHQKPRLYWVPNPNKKRHKQHKIDMPNTSPMRAYSTQTEFHRLARARLANTYAYWWNIGFSLISDFFTSTLLKIDFEISCKEHVPRDCLTDLDFEGENSLVYQFRL